MSIEIKPLGKPVHGEVRVPGDKSISHRAVMLSSIAEGTSRVRGFLRSDDCMRTLNCFRALGVHIEENDGDLMIEGKGLHSLTAPSAPLYTGNSGTTTRLIAGILSGQPFPSHLSGDPSIERRPMGRIIKPLSLMGADIVSDQGNERCPLTISPSTLHGITYETPVASAQVKSAILLAGLYADSPTTVIEPSLSRDHTERMLKAMGADIRRGHKEVDGTSRPLVTLTPGHSLDPLDMSIPGDISSAAYYLALSLLVPGSDLTIRNVNINPTRAGILSVIKNMGGKIDLLERRMESKEEVSDIHVVSSPLHGTLIGGDLIPTLIDEIPVISVLAAFSEGETIIKDAAELKVKESDRIEMIRRDLSRMGACVEAREDGLRIEGGSPLHGALIDTASDHRIAMAFTIAGLALDPAKISSNEEGAVLIDDPACVGISWPGFYSSLDRFR